VADGRRLHIRNRPRSGERRPHERSALSSGCPGLLTGAAASATAGFRPAAGEGVGRMGAAGSTQVLPPSPAHHFIFLIRSTAWAIRSSGTVRAARR
jgi:hypothetical protein